jgi:plastocyanin
MKRRSWQHAVVWGAVVLFLAVLGVGTVMRSRTKTRASHTVTIDAARFEPALSIVKVGDVVTWINNDLVPHTATSRTGGFDSGAIDPGKSWQYTPTRAGDFAYVCLFHPTMTAVLRVK